MTEISGTTVSAPISLLSASFFGTGSLGPGNYGIFMNESQREGSVYEFSITLDPCADQASIPTLSEWGMVILGLFLIIFSVLGLYQKSIRHTLVQK